MSTKYQALTVKDAQQIWLEILNHGGKPYPMGGGSGTFPSLPLHSIKLTGVLASIAEILPNDRQVRVGCGITIAALQKELNSNSLQFPAAVFDPYLVTLGGWLGSGMSGSKGQGFSARRLLAATILTPLGKLIHSGAATQKDVAGYDFHRMLVGSFGQLGMLLEVTLEVDAQPLQNEIFRVLPKEFSKLCDCMEVLPSVVRIWTSHDEKDGLLEFVEMEGSPEIINKDKERIKENALDIQKIDLSSQQFWHEQLSKEFRVEGQYQQQLLPPGEALMEIQKNGWWGNYWEGSIWQKRRQNTLLEDENLYKIFLRHNSGLSPLSKNSFDKVDLFAKNF